MTHMRGIYGDAMRVRRVCVNVVIVVHVNNERGKLLRQSSCIVVVHGRVLCVYNIRMLYYLYVCVENWKGFLGNVMRNCSSLQTKYNAIKK